MHRSVVHGRYLEIVKRGYYKVGGKHKKYFMWDRITNQLLRREFALSLRIILWQTCTVLPRCSLAVSFSFKDRLHFLFMIICYDTECLLWSSKHGLLSLFWNLVVELINYATINKVPHLYAIVIQLKYLLRNLN